MYMYMYIYIYIVSPSRRIRPVTSVPSSSSSSYSAGPSIRSSVRPVVVVRPLSVRPRPSHRRRPSYVRPSRRPPNYHLHEVA